jgi:hypothetical protein
VKICRDCKYYAGGNMCRAPQNRESSSIDLVTGESVVRWHWQCCTTLRRNSGFFYIRWAHQCGKSGRWFVKKED